MVNGDGHIQAGHLTETVGLYDVVLAQPHAEAPTLTAGDTPLNFLSFYLKPFLARN